MLQQLLPIRVRHIAADPQHFALVIGDIWFATCLSLANREHGFRLESDGSITIVDSHAFSNGVHAVLLVGSPLSVSIQNTLISSSGKNGIRAEISPDKFSTIKIQGVNLTGHYYSAAIEVEDATDIDFEISCCLVTDNFNGGISLDGITGNSTISILGSNFTRNRGSIVSIPLIQDSDVILHGNSFTANQLNNFGEHEAVVDIATFAEAPGSKIRVEDNEFEQNTMNNVLELRHLGGTICLTCRVL
ncbi:unnamed protein product [Cylicostephanus goldi]|uniref:Right handed beta helix domain-containing protein n=1 Tax=Cylicostephanus goldi TaxID=71465 RepID=A0A3P6QPX3_CYLGO|nr:unnamed protein product [Cylicostephanus goldi]